MEWRKAGASPPRIHLRPTVPRRTTGRAWFRQLRRRRRKFADEPLSPMDEKFSQAIEDPVDGINRTGNVAEAWEKLMKAVNDCDDEMVKNWKEDIDTLLVFAGLFSAVVSAFTVESYRWLGEDPGDATVVLLTQISNQLSNSSTPLDDVSSSTFKADDLSIRVNTFWFLSLILSLSSGLFALLSKQWLREHRRIVPTSSSAEALGLRYMRNKSLEIWGVPSLLALLPILLEVALLLFFAGIIDLLRSLHHIPFIAVATAAGVSAGMYLITMILPALTVLFGAFIDARVKRLSVSQPTHITVPYLRFICPYKSPQAWVLYSVMDKLVPLVSKLLAKCIKVFGYVQVPRWHDIDLQVVRRFDRNPTPFWTVSPGLIKVYELAGLDWATRTFQDSPAIILPLQSILGTIQPTIAMSAIVRLWPISMWMDISSADVENALNGWSSASFGHGSSCYIYRSRQPKFKTLLDSNLGIQLLYYQAYWREQVYNIDLAGTSGLFTSLSRFQQAFPEKVTGLRFYFPFHLAEMLWTDDSDVIRRRGLELVEVYMESWKAYPGPEEPNDERLAFISVLAKHINRSRETPSEILKKPTGQKLLHYINAQIILHVLYKPANRRDHENRRGLMVEWEQAKQRAKEVGNLPDDYFSPIDPSDIGAIVQSTAVYGSNLNWRDIHYRDLEAGTTTSLRLLEASEDNRLLATPPVLQCIQHIPTRTLTVQHVKDVTVRRVKDLEADKGFGLSWL
ncbi:hypothetical protein Moror_11092 [Moniliophthora roreri MCA 2997]|uniref:DUF6535 domain-containing protein n=1 Tax=Moniliophthora roreri (strain MCA 2997) TaxID=1381753 RepID=V2WQC3_MONRO|nr:hypothetical protein Moror_11092 [Moniliophthora roreri MCA 2997]